MISYELYSLFFLAPGTRVEEGGGHGVIRERSITLGVFIIITCISRSKRYMRESGSSNGLGPVLNSQEIFRAQKVVILQCTRQLCSVLCLKTCIFGFVKFRVKRKMYGYVSRDHVAHAQLKLQLARTRAYCPRRAQSGRHTTRDNKSVIDTKSEPLYTARHDFHRLTPDSSRHYLQNACALFRVYVKANCGKTTE